MVLIYQSRGSLSINNYTRWSMICKVGKVANKKITRLCAVSFTLPFGSIWDLRNALVGDYVVRTLFSFEVNEPLDRLQRLLRLKN